MYDLSLEVTTVYIHLFALCVLDLKRFFRKQSHYESYLNCMFSCSYNICHMPGNTTVLVLGIQK